MVLKVVIALAFVFTATPLWSQELTIERMIVAPIDQIALPARATGLLAEMKVREGDAVQKDQMVASLDDAQARIEAERAATQLQIFAAIAKSDVEIDLAQKALERSEQAIIAQGITRQIAQRKASNEIRVQAAQKAAAVATNEWNRAVEARKSFVDSVSRSEIDGLTLAMERAELETKQALFDREMDVLLAKAEDAAAHEQRVAMEQARLGVEKARNDQAVAVLKEHAAQHEAELAALEVDRHRLRSPVEGVVVKVHRQSGQWVETGEPIVEVLRLNRLRAEGYVAQEIAMKIKAADKVMLHVHDDATITRLGEVVFVNPEVDPVNGEVRIWIEFDNSQNDVLPGMRMTASVKP